MHITHFLYSPVDGCLGSFCILTIVTNTAMNMGVCISFYSL